MKSNAVPTFILVLAFGVGCSSSKKKADAHVADIDPNVPVISHPLISINEINKWENKGFDELYVALDSGMKFTDLSIFNEKVPRDHLINLKWGSFMQDRGYPVLESISVNATNADQEIYSWTTLHSKPKDNQGRSGFPCERLDLKSLNETKPLVEALPALKMMGVLRLVPEDQSDGLRTDVCYFLLPKEMDPKKPLAHRIYIFGFASENNRDFYLSGAKRLN